MSKKEDKRQLLIDAAYKVFARKGYANASIKDIANEAEITPGLVHYYFKNKEEILFAVQQKIQSHYHQKYDGDEKYSLSPFDVFKEIKERSDKEPDWYRLRYEIFSLGLKNEGVRKEAASILKSGRDSLSEPLKHIVGQQYDDSTEMAGILLACFDGLALQKIVDPDFDIDKAYQLLVGLLEIYLRK
ncbi:TetR family transcriptional regulator [Bacillus oleivorans]|uniref:TetR family transcriptional regulator n=1 Tax=Bacillus oleivorans TaxID=1448271 RepID=A0A285D3P4_9BACI|nr:TetR/AcrR family transcriptional regulator [Bacillus oleivorans]SNX74399.1 TetR family transcriptional regulator [Bacillus oleivorans]